MCLTMVRWLGRVCLSVMVVALSCGPAVAQDTAQPAEQAEIVPQPVAAEPASSVEIRPTQPQPATTTSTEAAAATDEKPLEPIPDARDSGPVEIDAASFKGVTPGLTTMAEVEKAWGAPMEITKQGTTLAGLYAVEPFERIEVSYYDRKVASIVIRFDQSFPVSTVAQQLELTNVRPALVSNELGEILGQVYPERGVLFAFQPAEKLGGASRRVAQIILEPISAEPFVLRAETYMKTEQELSLADLRQALKLQPANARAHWLHSRLLVAMEDFDNALAASGQAVRLEPGNPEYRVTWAQTLGQMGRVEEAIQQAQKAIDSSRSRPHIHARASCLMGDLVASGPRPDFKRAIHYHMQAVKAAEALTTNKHPAIRRSAKEVLLDTHLGAAHDIAWGTWKRKEEAVTKWLTQADAFAEDLIENEQGSQELRLRVCTRALAAHVGMQGKLDPEKWAKEAIRTGEQLIALTSDATLRAQFQWDLGMALYDALQIYQMRDDHDTALRYGEWAVEYLEEGDRQKQSPATGYLLGRLYFRLGAVHAIRDGNHHVAITWFDKAIPLLEKPLPKEAADDLGRHGETFVSMGVSHWETGQREKALELTNRGVGLVEQAVKQGLLGGAALAVPYDNLASMHRQLGSEEKADEYQKMAAKIKGTSLK